MSESFEFECFIISSFFLHNVLNDWTTQIWRRGTSFVLMIELTAFSRSLSSYFPGFSPASSGKREYIYISFCLIPIITLNVRQIWLTWHSGQLAMATKQCHGQENKKMRYLAKIKKKGNTWETKDAHQLLHTTRSGSDEDMIKEKENEAVHKEESRIPEKIPNRLHSGEATFQEYY